MGSHARRSGSPLTERQQQLLRTLVRLYIMEGQPVGSRTLVQESGVGVSSATVRSVMAELEARGFVDTPHTSAGRVPTAKAYRFFIDTLVTLQPLDEAALQAMREQLDPDKPTPALLASASHLLSQITRQTGLVTVPRSDDGEGKLRHVEFLPLSGFRVLVILVLDEKDVQNRIIHTEREYSEIELRSAANYVNSRFAGKALGRIREDLLETLRDTRESIDELLETAISLASRALASEDKESGYVVAGQSHLLDRASTESMARLRELFEAFQQQKDILSLLERSARAEGVRIFVGEEADFEPLLDFSLVTAPYHTGGRSVGVLAVIGPTRMAYDRVIPVVDVTARMLSAALRGE